MVSRLKLLSILAFLILLSEISVAAPTSFVYQGQIIKANGTPLSGNPTTFTIQILSPGTEGCVLYEEKHILNMSHSEGVFSLPIGVGARTGADFEDTSNLVNIFKNSTNFIGITHCADGSGNYGPSSLSDRRKLRLTYNDGSGDITLASDHNIQSVPFAWDAKTIDGLAPTNFVQVNALNNLTQTKLESLFNGSNYATLLGLASGTTPFVGGGANGAAIPGFSADPVTPPAGSMWLNTTTNEMKYNNGSSIEVIGAGGGGAGDITAVTTTAPLLGGASSGAVALSIAYDNSSIGLNGSSQLEVKPNGITSAHIGAGVIIDTDLASDSVTTAKILNANVTDAKIASVGVQKIISAMGQYLTYQPNGAACIDGEVLKWDTLTGWECGTDIDTNTSAVSTVFGRAGVVAATAGDYTATQITNTPAGAIAATTAQAALNELDSEKLALTGGTLTGAVTTTSSVMFNAQNEARYGDSDSSSYAAIRAPTTIATNYVLTLPDTDGNSGEVLTTDGAGILTWSAAAGGDILGVTTNSGSALTGGDTSGTPVLQVVVDDASIEIATNALQIKDDGVTAAKILDANVTDAKIVDVSVDKITSASGKYFKYMPNATECASGGVMKWNATDDQWECGTDTDTNTSAVTTVFGRAGVITATGGDYTAGQITNVPAGAIAAVTTQAAIDELDAEKLALAGGTLTGAVTTTSTFTFNAQNEVHYADSDSSNYAAIRAPATIASNYVLTLPDTDGNSGEVLTTDGAGVLTWAAASGGDILGVTTNSGSGLTGGASSGTPVLQVVVDDASIEIATNTIQIKDDGVTTAKILNANVTDAKIASVSVDKISSASGKYFKYMPNATECANGGVMKWNATDDQWECGTDTDTNTSAVTTVFGRAGVVTATSGDYTAGQITNVPAGAIAATTAQAAIDELDAEKLALAGGTLTGAVTTTSSVTFNAQNEAHFADSDSSNYAAIRAPASIISNYVLTLPDTDGGAGEVLTTDGAGVLSWAAAAGGDILGVTTNSGSGLTGGLTSGTPVLQVVVDNSSVEIATNTIQLKDGGVTTAKILDANVTNAKIVSMTVDKVTSAAGKYFSYMPNAVECSNNGILKWNATDDRWECGSETVSTGDITDVVAGTGLTGGATSGSATLNVDIGTAAGQLFTIDAVPHCALNQKIEITSGPVYTFSCVDEYTPATMADADNDTKIQVEASADEDKIRFDTFGSERMIIDNTGKVGIGTSSPTQKFTVVGGTGLITNTSAPAGFIFERTDGTAAAMYAGQNNAAFQYDSGFPFEIKSNTRANVLANTGSGATSRLLIETNGNVGINSGTSPGSKLEVKGSTADSTASALNIIDSSDASKFFVRNDGKIGIGTATPAVSLDLGSKTDAILLPKGTTAQQPASPVVGLLRYNTTDSTLEYYNGAWKTVSSGAAGSYLSTTGGTLTGAVTTTSSVTFNAQNEARFADSDSSNYGSIRAPATIAANYILTLPDTDGNNGEVLTTDGSGVLNWTAASAGDILGVTTNSGSGLSGGAASGTATLQVVVDNSTVEIATNTIQLKDAGITAAKLAANAVTTAKILDANVTDAKIVSMAVDKITSASGKYFSYMPNAVECADNGILKWNATANQWECGTESVSAGDITDVVAGAGLTGGATTGSATLNVDIGTATGQLFTIDAVPHCAPNQKIEITSGPVYTFSCVDEYASTSLADADGDTKIQVEESADEDIIRFDTFGTERMIIDKSGNVGIGTSSPSNPLSIERSDAHAGVAVTNTSSTTARYPVLQVKNYTSGFGGYPQIKMTNSRGSSGAGVAVQAGDSLGDLSWWGQYDATNANIAASISSSPDENFSSTAAGSNLRFYTAAATTTTLTERLRITSTGRIGIGNSNPAASLDVGSKTDAVILPKGTTAQQPASPVSGMIRYNTTDSILEYYNGAWTTVSTGVAGAYLSSTGGSLSGLLTISSGGANVTGGVDNNSGGITEAGSITGVGANITGTTALTVAAGGTNQNLTLNASGTGATSIGNGGGTQFQVLNNGASTVNYVTVKGATTGNAPVIGTGGSDTNIDLKFTPKGTGNSLFTGGNVGIGTSTPTNKLEVNGTLFANTITGGSVTAYNGGGAAYVSAMGSATDSYSYSSMQLANTANTKNWMIHYRNGTTIGADVGKLMFNYYDGSTYKDFVTLTPTGSVGIGTTAPSAQLTVYGATQLTSAMTDAGSSAGVLALNGSSASAGSGGALVFSETQGVAAGSIGYAAIKGLLVNGAGQTIGDLAFSTRNATGDTALTERMRISYNGKVGIGTAAPAVPLHVVGEARATNFSDPNGAYNINLGSGNAEGRGLVAGYSGGWYGGIGYNVRHTNTTATLVAPNADTSSYMVFHNGGFQFLGAPTGIAGRTLSFTALMNIDSAGKVGIGAVSPSYKLDVNGTIRGYGITDSSDIRLKNNVEPLSGDFDKLQKLQGVSYFWNDTKDHDTDKQVGLIAQDIEKVYPELVETDDKGMKSVNYSHLVAPIIEAFKSLVSRFNGFEREIASLKAENAKIKSDAEKQKQENARIKEYLCAKDPTAPICAKK